MQVARRLVVVSFHSLLDAHDDVRYRAGQRRNGAVHAHAKARVQQRVDAGQHHVLGLAAQQQVGERLQVAAALLHANHAGHLVHDAQHQVHAEVIPGDHVVDQDRQAGSVRNRTEVLDRRVGIGLEQVVHRRDLQCGDLHALEHVGAIDGGTRALHDQAGQERHAPCRGLVGLLHDRGELGVGQGVALARAAAGYHAVGTVFDDEVNLLTQAALDQFAFHVKGHGDGGEHAGQLLTKCGVGI